MTFGRKGLPAGTPPAGVAPAQRQPLMPDAVSNQVAAFLAEERQRAAAGEAGYREGPVTYHHTDAGSALAGREGPAGARKSMLLAYVLWWFAYPFSAHRFYLGDTSGAIRQCGAFLGSLALLLIGVSTKTSVLSALSGIVFLGTVLWVIADMFLIPGLCRRANARIDAAHRIFA